MFYFNSFMLYFYSFRFYFNSFVFYFCIAVRSLVVFYSFTADIDLPIVPDATNLISIFVDFDI